MWIFLGSQSSNYKHALYVLCPSLAMHKKSVACLANGAEKQRIE